MCSGDHCTREANGLGDVFSCDTANERELPRSAMTRYCYRMQRLRVPAVLVVTVLASAGCKSSEECVDRCVPKVYQDAGVADAAATDAGPVACPAEPDPQGQCPAGCEPQYCFA
jgi:hypothetical protein